MTHAAMKKWSVRFFVLACGVTVAACWFVGSKLVAPAQCPVPMPDTNLAIRDCALVTGSGCKCAAWLIPNYSAEATVILAHPIRANRRAMFARAKLYHELGYSVLLIDLQGHGESGGQHITFGHLEQHDVLAAVEFVREQSPTHRIAVDGWSLGGAAALLASSPHVDALILESVYSTIDAATHNRLARHLGGLAYAIRPLLLCQLPWRLGVSAQQLRPIDSLSNCECPVLIMAGARDEHTTLAETKAMFAAAKHPKELVIFKTAKHDDLFRVDRERYEQAVAVFLRRHLALQPQRLPVKTLPRDRER